jgi:hypothetical protein
MILARLFRFFKKVVDQLNVSQTLLFLFQFLHFYKPSTGMMDHRLYRFREEPQPFCSVCLSVVLGTEPRPSGVVGQHSTLSCVTCLLRGLWTAQKA